MTRVPPVTARLPRALIVGMLLTVLLGTLHAGAARAADDRAERAARPVAERWIVVVARAGGSAIGPRGRLGALPRSRAIPGDARARRTVDRLLAASGIRPIHRYRHAFDGFAARLTRAQVARLARDPRVAVLAPDLPTRVDGGIRAAGVRPTPLTEPVLPTGIRRSHADRGPLSRIDGVDDLLDVDVAVVDTGIAPSPELRIAGGHDCSGDDPQAWRDREGHGTHVSGTIAARDDGRGVVGVAPGARLWAVKIFDDDGNGLLSEELCGLDHVLGLRDPKDPSRPRIEVVNLSIGQWLAGAQDQDCGRTLGDLIHGAICALVADGTLVVVAAGNQSVDASRRQPAAYDEALTVSALADLDGRPGGLGTARGECRRTTREVDDTYAGFSNFGRDVDIIAPGKCILSTLPRRRFGMSSGTSMATPHVSGAAALLAAAHPGATPGQMRAALLGAATDDWLRGTDPDRWPDPLLDVGRLDRLPDLALSAGAPADDLAAGGLTWFDVAIDRLGGHRGPVAVSVPGLPDGVTAEIAPMPAVGSGPVRVTLRAADGAPAGLLQVSVRATDGDLVRSTTTSVRIRSGGPSITFSEPGDAGTRLTAADRMRVAFSESTAGDPPVDRQVLRQSGAPVTAGTCRDVDWAAVGSALSPGELDPAGSPGTGWAFDADLVEDGCSRWVVRLVGSDGDSVRFDSAAVLRDTTDPRAPIVRASGEGVWQREPDRPIWVRAGSGRLTLVATGRDAGSGVEAHLFGPLSVDTGWSREAGSSLVLAWTAEALPTALEVRATDRMGRTGPARTTSVVIDGAPPTASGWADPRDGTRRLEDEVPELEWRRLVDPGSGAAVRQPVRRQSARGRDGGCDGVTWRDDGPEREVARMHEEWDVRSGWCYRWILHPTDNVGNRGDPAVSGVVFLDITAPTGDFLAPDEGTLTRISCDSFTVRWTERARVGGGGSARWLEHEQVRAAGDRCPTAGWRMAGTGDAGPSPHLARRLRAGWCHRWRLNLSDARDNVSTELSGTVLVDP